MTLSILIVSGVALLVSGGAVGWSLRGENTSKVIEAQTTLIGEIQTQQTQLLEATQRPIVIDAEIRAALADLPPACIVSAGGDPLSPACALQACWRYGQSAAQRPDCDGVEKAALDAYTAQITTAPPVTDDE